MKIGLLTSVLARTLGYQEAVDWAGASGFETLELDVCSSALPVRRSLLNATELLAGGESELARYTEPLKRNDLSIGSLFYYGVNNLDPDPDVRGKAQQGLRESIRAAALLGASAVVTAVGSHLKHADRSRLNPWGIYYHGAVNAEGRRIMEEGFQVAAESYEPIAEFAREHGVRIAFEPSALGGGAGGVAHSPETFDGLFKVADHPALGLNFDPSHFLWQGIDYLTYAGRMAKAGRVFTCHGKDCEILWERVRYAGFLGDGWWRHRIPGWGQVAWVDLIKTLRANGYDFAINVEHEDPLFGYGSAAEGRTPDLELVKKGCRMGLEYLKHARDLS